MAYACIKKEVCPESYTLGITHAKLLALVGYLWCTLFVLNYYGVYPCIILNMWPSFNVSTLYVDKPHNNNR